MYFADMHLEIFLADFAVFRVFWGISRDFAEIPEFRGSTTARIIRSPVYGEAPSKREPFSSFRLIGSEWRDFMSRSL